MGPDDAPQGRRPLPKDSDWLLSFLPQLRRIGPQLLELGCGPGIDAATLLAHGFELTGLDRAPLARAHRSAPRAQLLRADLAAPLPFRDASFDAALSSLALHYLPWRETRGAFAETRRVLRSGAPFLFRVNATDDYFHGAGEGEQLEPNFYSQPGAYHAETKRFFDDEMVRAAVAGAFEITHLEHKTIYRFDDPKAVWECLAFAI